MGVLDRITGPRDLRDLDDAELDELAAEIRDFLVRKVSRTGGHLGPNLGVVELTLALHRVFDSPRDRVVFDTGHQAYVHKMRHRPRRRLRQAPRRRAASPATPARPSPSTTSSRTPTPRPRCPTPTASPRPTRSAARTGTSSRSIGDGALTGGMAWEALNNIARRRNGDRRLVIVVNDNGRSYTPTVGGLADHLTTLRTNPRYEQVLDLVKRRLNGVRGVGPAVYDALHAMKKGMKDALAPQGLFEDLGLKYVGPDRRPRPRRRRAGARPGQAVRRPGDRARDHPQGLRLRPGRAARGRPVPRPGRRSTPRPARRTPRARSGPTCSPTRSSRSARERPDVVAITAAMMHPVGLHRFAARVPRADLRRRHRRAARRHVRRRPRDGRAAPGRRGLRDLPQPRLRPGADGRRAAPVRRHVRAGPLPA